MNTLQQRFAGLWLVVGIGLGTGLGVAHTFVGSRRYRVTVKGPGGHSFADFGTPLHSSGGETFAPSQV